MCDNLRLCKKELEIAFRVFIDANRIFEAL